MTICISLLLDRIASYPNDRVFLRIIFIIAGICFPLLVGFSRLYNGVHSLDQIFLGLFIGVWLSFVNHFLLRELIIEHAATFFN